MKRLIIVSIMLMSTFLYVQDDNDGSTDETYESSHDTSSNSSDETSDVTVDDVHHISLDTIDNVEGSGNWLNKRIWFERTTAVFDEIRLKVSKIADMRSQFYNEVNTVGHKIDLFFEDVDFTQGQLDDKFKEMLTALDTELKFLGDLSETERNLQKSIKEELGTIEQIGKDIKSIHEVDNKIDQTLMQALKTIDECKDYETKAWDSFKLIIKELDDKKARTFYYQINNYKQNIDQKSNYLTSSLLPYLHNVLVAKIETNIAKINQAIEVLKLKGIDLQKIMHTTQEDDIAHLKAREKEAADIAVQKALEAAAIKEKEDADIAAKALEEAKKQSFDYVMHQYYEQSIGKVVNFVHAGYMFISQFGLVRQVSSYIASYSSLGITYIAYLGHVIKNYLHHIVESVTLYFSSPKNIKTVEKDGDHNKAIDANHADQSPHDSSDKESSLVSQSADKKTVESTASSALSSSTVSPVVATSDLSAAPINSSPTEVSGDAKTAGAAAASTDLSLQSDAVASASTSEVPATGDSEQVVSSSSDSSVQEDGASARQDSLASSPAETVSTDTLNSTSIADNGAQNSVPDASDQVANSGEAILAAAAISTETASVTPTQDSVDQAVSVPASIDQSVATDTTQSVVTPDVSAPVANVVAATSTVPDAVSLPADNIQTPVSSGVSAVKTNGAVIQPSASAEALSAVSVVSPLPATKVIQSVSTSPIISGSPVGVVATAAPKNSSVKAAASLPKAPQVEFTGSVSDVVTAPILADSSSIEETISESDAADESSKGAVVGKGVTIITTDVSPFATTNS